MKKVLITGAAGFIGSNLSQACLEEGWIVHGIDNFFSGYPEFINPKLDYFLAADYTSKEGIKLLNENQYDTVFHLAALPRVSYSVKNPLKTHHFNVNKTLELLNTHLTNKGNIGRFIFASSSSVYGGAEQLPTPETSIRNAKSPYALQKICIEDYLKIWYELYGLDSVSLRFFNVFGPNQIGSSPYSTAVSAWVTAAMSNQPLRIDGDGTQTRDLCFVSNTVDALILAAKHNSLLKAEAFNVACGNYISNNEILEYIRKAFPNISTVSAPTRPGDVKHTHADLTKIESVLGYKPKVQVYEGIDKTISWFKNNWEMISKMPAHSERNNLRFKIARNF